MATINEHHQTAAVHLGALLDAGDGAVVTLVVGDTHLAAHRSVLAARSPVLGAMFCHDMLEANSGKVTVTDVEGPVIRQMLSYLYTLQAPLVPSMAPKLLVAADKYGVLGLKGVCEQQVATQLTVENAAATAVLAVRHSCLRLRAAAISFIKAHNFQVMGTQGWADAMSNQVKDVIEVSRLLAEEPAETTINTMASDTKVKETTTMDLGTLLDAGGSAVVTLVAGDTQLVVHRAVLAATSPVFKAMFDQNMLEASSGQVTIADIEGPVLRQLLAYCYTQRVPQLPIMAPQLLAAADRYGMSDLKTQCEQQVVAQLTIPNAAATAVLAVRHSCTNLTVATVAFIKAHFVHVVGTQGWAHTMHNQTKDLIEVSRLLAEPPSEIRSLSGEEKGGRLIQAATEGAVEKLWELLAAGADVGARDEEEWTALHCAADKGHLHVVRCLLEGGAEVDARNCEQHSALHEAAYFGHTAVVRMLVASSADPDARDKSGCTPLHWAADRGHAETAAELLQAGADREATDNKGKKPLDWARENNHQEVVQILTSCL